MLLLTACSDPPPPPLPTVSAELPAVSEAVRVHWFSLEATVHRPIALFVDTPGGPMDRVASDADVTTFLNDRFHPILVTPEQAPDLARPNGAVWFINAEGCLLVEELSVEDPLAWIQHANKAVLAMREGDFIGPLAAQWERWHVNIPMGHPLRLHCSGSQPRP